MVTSTADATSNLLGGGVLGDGLGAFGHGVLGELTGEEEADGGLDFPGGDRGLGVVLGEAAGLVGDALKDVVDERVHDHHGLGADAGVGVNLLQHLVDVDAVRLLALGAALLLVAIDGGLSLLGLLFTFLGDFRGHLDGNCTRRIMPLPTKPIVLS